MSEFRREDRYIVIKYSDMEKLPRDVRRNFSGRCRSFYEQMLIAGAPARSFLVVESDWPEYEPAWQMIERRMTGQPPVTAAEELDAVLHWRGKHAQVVREREALQAQLTVADQRVDDLQAIAPASPATEVITDEQLFAMANRAFGRVVDHDLRGNPITDYSVLLTGSYGPAVRRLVELARANPMPAPCDHLWTDNGEFEFACSVCGLIIDTSTSEDVIDEANQEAFEAGNTEDGEYILSAEDFDQIVANAASAAVFEYALKTSASNNPSATTTGGDQ
jgi:hypothetical protein